MCTSRATRVSDGVELHNLHGEGRQRGQSLQSPGIHSPEHEILRPPAMSVVAFNEKAAAFPSLPLWSPCDLIAALDRIAEP